MFHWNKCCFNMFQITEAECPLRMRFFVCEELPKVQGAAIKPPPGLYGLFESRLDARRGLPTKKA